MADEKEQTNVITGERPEDAPDTGADAWLDANLPGDESLESPAAKALEAGGTEAQPPGDKPRDEKGRFTKSTESEDSAEPTESADSVVNPDDYRRALNALKRAQTPQGVIDTMDPQAVTDWGLSLSKIQAESDGYGKQVSDLKAELAKLSGVEAEKAEPAFDLNEALQPLREYYGDEGAEPIKGVLEQVLKAATPTQAPNTEKLDKLAAELTDQVQRDARREIQGMHPEFGLNKDDRWQKTVDFRRGDRNEYSSELEALTAACRHVFADEIISEYKSKLKETHEARDAGQPTPPSGPSPPGELTDDALEDALLNALQDRNQPEADRIKKVMEGRRRGGTDYLTFEQLTTRIGR